MHMQSTHVATNGFKNLSLCPSSPSLHIVLVLAPLALLSPLCEGSLHLAIQAVALSLRPCVSEFLYLCVPLIFH